MQAVIHLIAKSTAFNSLVVYIKIEKWDGSKIACRDFKKFQENDL